MKPELRVPFQPKKERPTGKENAKCRKCGSYKGVIRKYGLYYCRKCFREIAKELGFEKR